MRSIMATERQSYMTSEKLKIIQFAEEHGNQAAQREFGIAESNVRLGQVQRKSSENAETSMCRSWKKSSLASTRITIFF